MKTKLLTLKKIMGIFLFTFVLIYGCSKDESVEAASQNAENIDTYLKSLSYSPDELLGAFDTQGSSSIKMKGEETSESVDVYGKNTSTNCTTTEYNLKTNFQDIPILDPNKGIIWPGALVKGDASLRNGLPTSLKVKRAPLTLRVDLPGIGDAGTIVVVDAENSNVNAEIDKALEWWNANAFRDGYVNPSSSKSEATTLYSKKQMSLELGLNADWAGNTISSEFDYESTSERRVAMMVYKQVFYNISMDQPLKPSDVFHESVPLSEVEGIFNSSSPPAYIHNVSYGRIIMFRMETSVEASDSDLKAAFGYAAGKNSLDAETELRVKNILEKSSIKTFAIGGNAANTAELVSAKNFGDLDKIIKGTENAIYSRTNPGVPIAYTVRYLKDNTIAKMGFATDYKATNCSTSGTVHPTLQFINDTKKDFRVGITFKNNLPDAPQRETKNTLPTQILPINENEYVYGWIANETSGSITEIIVPQGAYDIEIWIEEKEKNGYKDSYHHNIYGHVHQVSGNWERCYRATTNIWGLNLEFTRLKCK
ncbi:thiol-activated cytolysin family protein [Algibacter mikhailovii]|nr:thiol-activated cytolysin family protein [Algibacter mikhailovii]